MKKFFYSFLVVTIFVIGFSASSLFSEPIPGTYNLDGGFVITIDNDNVVRLKSPNGKIYKGFAKRMFDGHATLYFNENVHIMHLNSDDWTIDEEIKYMYTGGPNANSISTKDEDQRVKVVSYSN